MYTNTYKLVHTFLCSSAKYSIPYAEPKIRQKFQVSKPVGSVLIRHGFILFNVLLLIPTIIWIVRTSTMNKGKPIILRKVNYLRER